MNKLFEPEEDVEGNLIELHSIVVCKVIAVQQDTVIAKISDKTEGRIPVNEFEDSDIGEGSYFEAEIIDFDDDGIPVMAWGSVIPFYEVIPYSLVRAKVIEIRDDMVLLSINKYRSAKIPLVGVESGEIKKGDIIEAEVVEPDDGTGYSLLGWGRVADQENVEISDKDEVPETKPEVEKEDVVQVSESPELGINTEDMNEIQSVQRKEFDPINPAVKASTVSGYYPIDDEEYSVKSRYVYPSRSGVEEGYPPLVKKKKKTM